MCGRIFLETNLSFTFFLMSQSWLPLVLVSRLWVTLKASKMAALIILPTHPVKVTLTFILQITSALVQHIQRPCQKSAARFCCRGVSFLRVEYMTFSAKQNLIEIFSPNFDPSCLVLFSFPNKKTKPQCSGCKGEEESQYQ